MFQGNYISPQDLSDKYNIKPQLFPLSQKILISSYGPCGSEINLRNVPTISKGITLNLKETFCKQF